jgi:hypothetical protein
MQFSHCLSLIFKAFSPASLLQINLRESRDYDLEVPDWNLKSITI